jgi:hypothetical protein
MQPVAQEPVAAYLVRHFEKFTSPHAYWSDLTFCLEKSVIAVTEYLLLAVGS